MFCAVEYGYTMLPFIWILFFVKAISAFYFVFCACIYRCNGERRAAFYQGFIAHVRKLLHRGRVTKVQHVTGKTRNNWSDASSGHCTGSFRKGNRFIFRKLFKQYKIRPIPYFYLQFPHWRTTQNPSHVFRISFYSYVLKLRQVQLCFKTATDPEINKFWKLALWITYFSIQIEHLNKLALIHIFKYFD